MSHQMEKDPYQDEEGKEYYSPSTHRSSSKYDINIEQLDLDRNKTEFPNDRNTLGVSAAN